MTERDSFEIAETKVRVFKRDNYTCRACGGSILYYCTPQLAHRIAATESNIKKFGKCVIHHDLNLAATCSLKCNDAQNIGFDRCAAEKLADEIRDELLKE